MSCRELSLLFYVAGFEGRMTRPALPSGACVTVLVAHPADCSPSALRARVDDNPTLRRRSRPWAKGRPFEAPFRKSAMMHKPQTVGRFCTAVFGSASSKAQNHAKTTERWQTRNVFRDI